jgi:hypothetical protein
MRGGTYIYCVPLVLLQALTWSSSACAQFIRDKGCPADPQVNSQRAAIVIESLEFDEEVSPAPEIRARLVEEFKQRGFHANSAADRDWEGELGEEIRTAFQDQGYFRVIVDPTFGLIRAEASRLHYWVSVQVESGPQYRLGEVRFENTAGFTEKVLRPQLPLQQGDLFSASQVRKGLENLTRLYSKVGYIDFTMEAQFDIRDETLRIDLTLRLDAGPKYNVGSLGIYGFDGGTERLLRTTFEVGQVLDGTAVHEFFKANSASLLSGTSEVNGVTIERNTQDATVDIVFTNRLCGTP